MNQTVLKHVVGKSTLTEGSHALCLAVDKYKAKEIGGSDMVCAMPDISTIGSSHLLAFLARVIKVVQDGEDAAGHPKLASRCFN